jgi:ABC-type glycerol-3-phosphate transport system substrate-binding protein
MFEKASILMAIALCAALACGGESETKPADTDLDQAQPAATDVPSAEADQGLTTQELQVLKQQFKAEATQEITAENAEVKAQELEAEIDAELAAVD